MEKTEFFNLMNNIDFSGMKSDIKPIALYLPQFHTFPENDEWWGKGFTEWTNVKKGAARFPGHDQPRIPHSDFGYYDLSDADTIRKQVQLAKSHGIYGFGIYYYWFSGKQLMKKPLDIILQNKDIDFPYFFIWANENWTRTWDGRENNILIRQDYKEDDPELFISGLAEHLRDGRYMRIDGKPVIGLYAPASVPDIREMIRKWRDIAKRENIGDLYILTCASNSSASNLNITDIIDGEYEFPPRLKGYVGQKQLPNNGVSYNYQQLVESERLYVPNSDAIDLYRGAMLNWDNAARKKSNYNCWHNFSIPLFYQWVKAEIVYSRKYLPENKRFIFINAWNEWGEGTYLEPDEKYGYSAINALSCAIYSIGINAAQDRITEIGTGLPVNLDSNWKEHFYPNPIIAVQAHVFYEDLISQIVDCTNRISEPFDLYISTNSYEKQKTIFRYVKAHSIAQHVFVEVFENKGRDVIPFLLQLEKKADAYKFVCHIHTKKSSHTSATGDIWREYLFENLLGNTFLIDEILNMFECNEKLGIVYPENIDLVHGFVTWGKDRNLCSELFRRMDVSASLPHEDIEFPAGNMFWARVEAIREIFNVAKFADLVPDEAGQLDGTVMHAIERCWVYLAETNGYCVRQTRSIVDNRPYIWRDQHCDARNANDNRKFGRNKPGKNAEKAIQRGKIDSDRNRIAGSIGVKNALKAVIIAMLLFIGKVIPPFRRIKNFNPAGAAVYSPEAIAGTHGVRGCMSIFIKTVLIFIHRNR